MSIKSLASQTLWYGLSNILGRFLSYSLVLILAYLYSPEQCSPVFLVYVIVPFLNILFTFGFETSYFRFSTEVNHQKLFNSLSSYLIISTTILSALLLVFSKQIMYAIDMQRNENFYFWMVFIIAIDTLTIIPFAKLRQDKKPKKFAFIKLANILCFVGFVLFYLAFLKSKSDAGIILPNWLYNKEIGIGYYIIANLIASISTFLFLLPEWKGYIPSIDKALIKKVLIYSYPILIVGFGGMINDLLSRLLYYKILKNVPIKTLDHEFGVFGVCYKLAVFATLFIQVFKMGAEPFFFSQSKNKDAPETYARVSKIFSIICCLIFLFITMNLDAFKLLVTLKYKSFGEGIGIVPILTLANIFLGIYYNLSVWYKITNNTMKGAYITIIGVIITIIFNLLLVPSMHYMGAAWATFFCYFSMMVISYIWGQKYYPIPYDVKNIFIYFGFVVGMYFLSSYLGSYFNLHGILFGLLSFIISTIAFLLIAIKLDKKEFASLPLVGKYIR